jgi:acyl-CoA thioesterase-1
MTGWSRSFVRRLRRSLAAALLTVAGVPACDRGEGPLVAFLGDSLTDGWRLPEQEAYPALLGQALAGRGRPIRVLNAGRSGDTVAQGLVRLPRVLEHEPDALVVALGINDALRGEPVAPAETALRRIVADARAAGVQVVLVGFQVPPGREDRLLRAYEAMYERLAAEQHLAFVPDLLAGVAGHRELLFPDGLHPNAAGHQRLAVNVRPQVEMVLAQIEAARR